MSDGCDADCIFESVCGNEIIEGLEECDDGNVENGDGCDSSCTNENFTILRGLESNRGRFGAGASDRWNLTADGTTVIEAETTGCDEGGFDTILILYAVNEDGTLGEEVASNDDAELGVNFCSRIEAVVEAGNYALAVEGFFDAAIDGYGLETLIYQDVSAGDDFDGAYPQNGDDLYVIDLAADGRIEFETSDGAGRCPQGTDTIVTVFGQDEEGAWNQVARNDDGGRGDVRNGLCSFADPELTAGTYRITVNGFGNRPSDGYVLNVAFNGECGDGTANIGEGCDDGNNDDGDGCAADCTLEPFCGDGTEDEGEECDDGNNDAGDGCSAECTFEQVCGNDALEGTEECDDGNVDNGDGCDALCTAEEGNVVRGIERNGGTVATTGTDRWNFTTDGPSLYTADTLGCRDGNFDTILALHPVNEDGSLGDSIDSNDDNADFGDTCSSLAGVLDAGNYALVVSGFAGRPVVGYELATRIWQNVGEGGDFNGATSRDGNDLYVLPLESAGEVSVSVGDDGCPGDTRMWIYTNNADGEREQVAFNDDSNGLCSAITAQLEVGVYEIEVDGFGGQPVPPYVLRVALPPVAAVEVCDDDVDNDLDDAVDCDDDDCAEDARCVALACSADALSENHDQDAATAIRPGVYEDLAVCAGADDWFTIDVCAGGSLRADILFANADGDLDAAMTNANNDRLASGLSVTDNESLAFVNDGDAAVQVYLRVYAFQGANDYDLDLVLENCPLNGDVRLVDGPSENAGRVEVLIDGVWGTVCDDSFGIEEATVICRQLGYAGAEDFHVRAAFGAGDEPTHLDDLACTGEEDNLLECDGADPGVENCSLLEDAGVTCIAGDVEAGGVFFSEYVEGSGNNKAVEIYNGVGEAIDLNGCAVLVYANGNTEPTSTIGLGDGANGPVAVDPGGTYVLCNGRAGEDLAPLCDQSSGALSFNGDDAVTLSCDGVAVDVFGAIGTDPGAAWEAGDISTVNRTLRRQCDIILGDDIGDDDFDPSAEWDGFPQDTFDDLGRHCQ